MAIEERYKVVNKYLREIRDIEVQTAGGVKNVMNVYGPLTCTPGKYLVIDEYVRPETFDKSLRTGQLKHFLETGAIVKVYYDTVQKKEVSSREGYYIPQEFAFNDSTQAIASVLQQEGMTPTDLKQMIAMFKQMKQPVPENNTVEIAQTTSNQQQLEQKADQPKEPTVKLSGSSRGVKPISIQPVAEPTEPQPNDNSGTIEIQSETIPQKEPLATERSKWDSTPNITDIETQKRQFSALSYQDKLKYIKAGNADNEQLLSWIMSIHKQQAVINACNKRIATLTK